MKVIKKNIYYCDYCNKKSLKSVIVHEKHCTANPSRTCRLCGKESIKEIIEKYKALFKINYIPNITFGDKSVTVKVEYLKEFTLDDIREELEYYCPNCLLAVIRCVGLNRFYFDGKFKFDYKKELQEWWVAVNEEERRKDEWDTY